MISFISVCRRLRSHEGCRRCAVRWHGELSVLSCPVATDFVIFWDTSCH